MAEEERMTLADVMIRELTPQQMDALQGAISMDLTHNFESISDFMSDVHVPDSAELLALSQEQEWSLREELEALLTEDSTDGHVIA